MHKKHNLPPLARIKIPLIASPFLFFKLLLQIWLCPQGEVRNDVFALGSPFLKGTSILTWILFTLWLVTGCLVQLFQLKTQDSCYGDGCLEIGQVKVLFPLDIRECCNSGIVSVEQKMCRWATTLKKKCSPCRMRLVIDASPLLLLLLLSRQHAGRLFLLKPSN